MRFSEVQSEGEQTLVSNYTSKFKDNNESYITNVYKLAEHHSIDHYQGTV